MNNGDDTQAERDAGAEQVRAKEAEIEATRDAIRKQEEIISALEAEIDAAVERIRFLEAERDATLRILDEIDPAGQEQEQLGRNQKQHGSN